MPESMTAASDPSYCKSPLRFETSRLLRAAGGGLVKMIAAALVIGKGRVYRMHEGEDANYLELLARELDRIELEAGRERVLPILRWMANRYGHGVFPIPPSDCTPDEIERCVAKSLRETTEAHAETLEAAAGGITPTEKPEALQQIYEGIASLFALAAAVMQSDKAAPAAQQKN